jgi:hypothetical protein
VPYWNRWMQALPDLGGCRGTLGHVLKLEARLPSPRNSSGPPSSSFAITTACFLPTQSRSWLCRGSGPAPPAPSAVLPTTTRRLFSTECRPVLTRPMASANGGPRSDQTAPQKLATALVSAAAAQPRTRRRDRHADWRAQRSATTLRCLNEA